MTTKDLTEEHAWQNDVVGELGLTDALSHRASTLRKGFPTTFSDVPSFFIRNRKHSPAAVQYSSPRILAASQFNRFVNLDVPGAPTKISR